MHRPFSERFVVLTTSFRRQAATAIHSSLPQLTMSFPLAAELNNLGVVRLNEGDLRGALDLFRESLSYTAGELTSSTGVPTSSSSSAAPVSPGPVTSVQFTNLKDTTVEEATSASVVANPTVPPLDGPQVILSTPFVHSKGIDVIPMPNAYSSDVLINTAIVSSIVVFNLAVVCHLKGLEGGPAANIRLLKAKSLYERSQRLLMDACIPCHSIGNPVTDMISMASLNNMAQLNYETGHYEESKQCFEQLIRFASTIVPALYGDPYVGSLMYHTKSNFLLNAIILQKPGIAPAA